MKDLIDGLVGVLVVAAVSSLFWASELKAQALPDGGVLYWPANPDSEQIQWYAIEVLDGAQWRQVHGTGTCQAFSQFSAATGVDTGFDPPAPLICYWLFKLPKLSLDTVQIGDEICARVTAVKAGERSTPSERACATVIATVQNGLGQPLQPVLIIR